jgi:hypothetical protein
MVTARYYSFQLLGWGALSQCTFDGQALPQNTSGDPGSWSLTPVGVTVYLPQADARVEQTLSVCAAADAPPPLLKEDTVALQ